MEEKETLEMTVDIQIRQSGFHGGSLQIRESLTLPVLSFLEMAQVLGQFHELAQRIRAARKGADGATA